MPCSPFKFLNSKVKLLSYCVPFVITLTLGVPTSLFIVALALDIIAFLPLVTLNVDVVLELPTHLSFPIIKRSGDDIYIYPENGASNNLVLYKYNPNTNTCKTEKILAKGYLADAVITDLFGEELLFATVVPNHNGKDLMIYKEKGKIYQEVNKVHFESNISRNAGDWFTLNNKVYRPCQDCNERYGEAVIIQEVSKVDDTLSFKKVNRICSTHHSYKLGCHTLNHYKGLIVIDVNGYRRPLLAKMVGAIMKFVRLFVK